MIELSVQEMRWRGLHSLIKYGRRIEKDIESRYYFPTLLRDHPFGLPIPKQPTSRFEQGVIRFVGWPGYTDVSVNNMIRCIAEVFFFSSVNSQIHYLRVILAEVSPKDRNQHRVYYEVGSTFNILMCGGCTDFSGGGGVGKMRMDNVFAVLSHLFGVKIETVTIPFESSEAAQQRLEKAIDDYHREEC